MKSFSKMVDNLSFDNAKGTIFSFSGSHVPLNKYIADRKLMQHGGYNS